MSDKPKVILGRDYIAALIEAGVVPTLTEQVTIRAKVTEPVRIDYKVFGDDRLLFVDPDMHGVPLEESAP